MKNAYSSVVVHCDEGGLPELFKHFSVLLAKEWLKAQHLENEEFQYVVSKIKEDANYED